MPRNTKQTPIMTSGEMSVAIGGSVAESVIVTGDQNNIVVENDGRAYQSTTVPPDKKVLSQDQAFERIGAAIRSNLIQLEQNINQSRKESAQFFKLTLIFASLGFCVVIGSIILLLLGQVTAGVVSATTSLIPEATAVLFFQKDKELRSQIDRYHQQLLESQKILTMVDVAETVSDEQTRDKLKQEIIFRVLGVTNDK
ncbi:MAG: TRADD-N-associated membrane domain-containing protein [Thiothrix sp.]